VPEARTPDSLSGAVQGRGHNVAVGVGDDDTVRVIVIHRYGDVDKFGMELDYDKGAARELARLLAEAADKLD
jgi:hypothetical protein